MDAPHLDAPLCESYASQFDDFVGVYVQILEEEAVYAIPLFGTCPHSGVISSVKPQISIWTVTESPISIVGGAVDQVSVGRIIRVTEKTESQQVTIWHSAIACDTIACCGKLGATESPIFT